MRTAFIVALVALVCATAVAAQTAPSSSGSPGPTPVTICDRITAAAGGDFTKSTAEVSALTTLVAGFTTGTNGVFNNAVTKDYFNGNINYRQNGPTPQPFASQGASPNFNTNPTAQSTLVLHFVQFLGSQSALACTASGFPAYSNNAGGGFGVFNQYQVHANMNITQTVFSTFNNAVLSAATAAGATSNDILTITSYLQTFGRNNANTANEICTQLSCACATGIVGDNCDQPAAASTASVSFVVIAAAALIALIAQRQ
jgi:hypothetical protein